MDSIGALAGSRQLRGVLTAVAVAICVTTIHPRGGSGAGLAVVCLIVVNCLVVAVRLVPAEAIPDNVEVAVFGFGAISAAAMMGVPRSGAVSVFAFVLTGQAGFRLATRAALATAALTSALCTGVLLLHLGPGYHKSPWYLGALTGVAVFAGMANRSHNDALRSAEVAAEQAELAAQAQVRAQTLAERGRIARDVHDVLAHSLAAVNMQLEVADALMDAGDVARAQQATQRAQSLVREGLAEVQRTVTSLREDALPLVDTLRRMLSSTTGDAGTMEVAGSPRELSIAARQAFVRCAQEALTNARKYAPDARVRVTLDYETDRTELHVVNGAPRQSARAAVSSGSGMGLVGMRERVALVGGTVLAGPVLDGDDAGGWHVTVVIPG